MLAHSARGVRLSAARMPAARLLVPQRLARMGLALEKPAWSPRGIRRVTSETLGDNNTGHIEAGPNEGILYFNNIFPLRLRWLMYLPFHSESALERLQHPSAASFDPVDLLRKALPENLPVHINGVILRAREGGAFVRFSHDPSTTAANVEELVNKSLDTKIVRPWFNPFHSVHARLVQGRPWLEDLYRPPSRQLKVEFLPPLEGADAKEITQEQLFSIFRPYGKLLEIHPQPTDSKVLPKYTMLVFSSIKQAIMAKNCLHGINVKSESDPNTALAHLKIGFERQSKSGWAKEWLFSHPRIVIPIVAALAAGITVAIFDPIRTWNIKVHIKQTFDITKNPLYAWFASRAKNLLSYRQPRDAKAGMSAVWDERKTNIDQIEAWLMESADTFIVVQGPRGSGKKEFVVDMALRNRKNKLVIDCKKIQEARGDSSTINAMAEAVGYRPVFSWMNSFSGLIDLAAQGATGMKTGFSETLDGQLNQILNSSMSALRQISLDERRKQDADSNVDDDVWLEAHPEKRPVIVIDNFLHKSADSSLIYDKISEWAATCTSTNIAHIIFLTTDVSYSKALSKALPDRVFRQISLSDASPDLARRFVLSHLNVPDSKTDSDSTLSPPASDSTGSASNPVTSIINKLSSNGSGNASIVTKHGHPIKDEQRHDIETRESLDLGELEASLLHLGGRLTDLEFLARRIKAGEPPGKAVQEIIDQSASEILKIYLSPPSPSAGEKDRTKQWTAEQAWCLVKALAQSDDGLMRYNELALADSFGSGGAADNGGGPDAVFSALEQAEMITITSSNGRAVGIKPGKPVFLPAFRKLADDSVLAARMDLGILGESVKGENKKIAKCEDELQLIGSLPKQPSQLDERVRYLLAKIMGSQRNIEKTEADMAALKKVLSSEF